MNKTILIGRLTADPQVKTTQSQVAFCSFTIAVDRKFKTAGGERQSDFISCIAWRQQAEFLGKYFLKGSRVAIVGNIQTRTYDDATGKKVYVTEVVADEIEFVDSKHDLQTGTTVQNNPPAPAVDQGFYPAMDDDTTLPFDL